MHQALNSLEKLSHCFVLLCTLWTLEYLTILEIDISLRFLECKNEILKTQNLWMISINLDWTT